MRRDGKGRGQLLAIAARALEAFPVDVARLRLVADGENITFRVTVTSGEEFLLRVHRPQRHGPDVDAAAAVGSELAWLEALRAQTDLCVPEPVRTAAGDLVGSVTFDPPSSPTATDATVPQDVRVVSLLRWMPGRIRFRSARPVHLRRLGDATARLHAHADTWTPPSGFTRIRWDADTFFGAGMVYGDRTSDRCWDLLPSRLRRRFDAVARDAGALMTALGEGPDQFGLVHADLHLENALFDGQRVRLIDFDDCGLGYRSYELAVTLWELRHRPGYPALRDALVAGYAAVRPLPPSWSESLDTFIAVREVAFGLWFVGMAQTKPHFAADLPEVLAGIEASLVALGVDPD